MMCCIVTMFCIFLLAPTLAVSIAGFVIGGRHLDATCDDTAVMQLSTWLFVYGGVGLGMVVCIIIALIMLIMGAAWAFVVLIATLIPCQLFMLAWNIVGAVSLFKDSGACQTQAYDLWAMTLAVLIIQWIGFFITCCSAKARNDD